MRNIEPKIINRTKNVLNDIYERTARRVRNEEIINAMPKARKPSYSKNFYKILNNTGNNNLNSKEEMNN